MSDGLSSAGSDNESVSNEPVVEYYLIRVPKRIDVKELNGIQVDLEVHGPSDNLIESKSNPEQCYSYDIISPSTTAISNLTVLTNTDDDEKIEIDPSYRLRGCINFYAANPLPDTELTPIVPSCPNDSIEDIVNRARGHSIKRKASPVKVKRERSASPVKSSKKHKHKRH